MNLDAGASGTVQALRQLMRVLAERVAVIVEESRLESDIPDHQRGQYFPIDLIVRDARTDWSDSRTSAIPFEELPQRIQALAERLGFTDLDIAILVIAMSVHLQPRFEHFYIVLNNEVETRLPSVLTTLRLSGVSPDDPNVRARFRSDFPLVSSGLLELSESHRPLLSQLVATPERFVTYALGDDKLAAEVLEYLKVTSQPRIGPEMLPHLDTKSEALTVFKCRRGVASTEQAYYRLAEFTSSDPLLVNAELLSVDIKEFDVQLRAAVREAALAGSGLIFDFREDADRVRITRTVEWLRGALVPVVILIPRRMTWSFLGIEITELPTPTIEQRLQWRSVMFPNSKNFLDVGVHIHSDPDEMYDREISGIAFRQLPKFTDELATVIEPQVSLADVVSAESVSGALSELVDRVRFRSVVIDEWKMRPGATRGRGITALFSGTSGTGKSMSAEAIAGELGVPLFRVNLATVVDKFIGETEKKLDRVFSAVEDFDGVLLFDEADALFGKRSEVSDSKDRYANLEVAYLLQRMESFDGLAILTTNLRANLDEAFLRRIDTAVDFPEPGLEERIHLWQACLKGQMGFVSNNDLHKLANLSLTGGSIRAAAVTAAYLAASTGAQIGRVHLLKGAQREWHKRGRLSFPAVDFANWLMEGPNVESDQRRRRAPS